MQKCAVIVQTEDGKLVVEIDNYASYNTIPAVAKAIGVEPEDIKLCSDSMDSGTYQLTKFIRKAEKLVTNPVDIEGFSTIQVEYGHIIKD